MLQPDLGDMGHCTVDVAAGEVVITSSHAQPQQAALDPEYVTAVLPRSFVASTTAVHSGVGEVFAGVDITHLLSIAACNADVTAPRYHVYCILCLDNGKKYYGSSVDVCKRYKSHQRKPPSRMAADAALYVPFQEHFVLYTLPCSFVARSTAQSVEKQLIVHHQTHLAQHGYNVVLGHPQTDPRWWAMRSKKVPPVGH